MTDILTIMIPSLGALGLMVLVIWLTGLSHPVVLDDDAPVIETVQGHFADAQVERITRSADGKSALVYMADAPHLVLVRALGDRMAVRPVTAKTLKKLSGHDSDLDIVLDDYTWPRIRMNFADAAGRTSEENAINTTIKEHAHA